jgi:hypothetical protein
MEHYQWHKENPNGYCLYCEGDPLDITEAKMMLEELNKEKPIDLQNHQQVREALYYAMQDVLKETGICCQCSSNALSNFVGGYRTLGLECVRYCRRGHKE